MTSRYKAEYGRSNGGVMNIVTKAGTNDLRGSWFTLFRDTAMNAKTETESARRAQRADRQAGLPPLPVRRLVRRPDRAATRRTSSPPSSGRSRTRSRSSTRRGSSPSSTARSRRRTARTCSPARSPRTSRRRSTWRSATAATTTRSPTARARPARAEQLGPEHERVQLDQPEPQLGARRRQAERVHLPVRRLRQRDHREQRRPAAHVPRTACASARTPTRRRRRSRRSTSSATTSRAARPAGAASATTSRSA